MRELWQWLENDHRKKKIRNNGNPRKRKNGVGCSGRIALKRGSMWRAG
jgi:hypothetical protein